MVYRLNDIYDYRYDYTKTMMMKLGLAYPEPTDTSKSHVLMTFEQALECIKKIDAMTPYITKIYYLVGWQYNGHDDKYPDFFEVNKALKRKEDKTARDSLIWLYEEAKKYNSVVSLHINFNDAYEDAPSFELFKKNNALIRKKNGKPDPIEKYNGKACYKTCFKGYWESGLFKKQIDKLIELLPFLPECGTVHVDNFQCYHNYAPCVTIAEMQDYRRKMIDYVHEKGIDITSEFTYKEDESLPNKPFLGIPRDHHSKTPMDTVGLIPASWWCARMTRRELIEIPPQLYTGGIYRNKIWDKYLYGNMHGEDIVKVDDNNWEQKFLNEFATVQVPYHFLCTKKRLGIKGFLFTEKCIFSDGVVSSYINRKITQNGDVLKENGTLFMPYVHKENCYFAYSQKGDKRSWSINKNAESVNVNEITPSSVVYRENIKVKDGILDLKINAHQALLIEVVDAKQYL